MQDEVQKTTTLYSPIIVVSIFFSIIPIDPRNSIPYIIPTTYDTVVSIFFSIIPIQPYYIPYNPYVAPLEMRYLWLARNDGELLTKGGPRDPGDKEGLWIMLRLFAKFPLMECALLWHCSLAYFLIISLEMVTCCTLFRQEPIPKQGKPPASTGSFDALPRPSPTKARKERA